MCTNYSEGNVRNHHIMQTNPLDQCSLTKHIRLQPVNDAHSSCLTHVSVTVCARTHSFVTPHKSVGHTDLISLVEAHQQFIYWSPCCNMTGLYSATVFVILCEEKYVSTGTCCSSMRILSISIQLFKELRFLV